MAIRKPIFYDVDAGAYKVMNDTTDVIKAGGFQGSGADLVNVNAAMLDGIDSLQFLQTGVKDTIGGFDGEKLVVKATANDETAANVKLINVQASNGNSMAAIDSEGDIICRNLQVNGSETVVNVISTTGLSVSGGTTLGNGNDNTIIDAGSGNFTVDAANITLNAGGDLGKIKKVGAPGAGRVNEGHFVDLYATNLYVGGIGIDGTSSNTFTINNDNLTADGEDSYLVFGRGSVSPHATIRWDCNNDKFEINQNVEGTGNITGATIGGIAPANLLSRNAAEVINQPWRFPSVRVGTVDNYATFGWNVDTLTIDRAVAIGKIDEQVTLSLNGHALNVGFNTINQALVGIGPTVTSANLNTLTNGANADTLHTHATVAAKNVESSPNITAGQAILGKAPVFMAGNNIMNVADAAAIATARVAGFTKAAMANGEVGAIVTSGEIAGAGSGWTYGQPIYLAVGGGLTQTAPSVANQVVIPLGIAKNATDMIVNIGEPLVMG